MRTWRRFALAGTDHLRVASTVVVVATAMGACGGRESMAPSDASAADVVDAAVVDATAEAPADVDAATTNVLPYLVLAAGYSVALDRAVLEGSDGNLHLVDPHTMDDQTIVLGDPFAEGPTLSVAPDGVHAAVAMWSGFPPAILYVDLKARTVVSTFPPLALGDGGMWSGNEVQVMLAANDIVYAQYTGFNLPDVAWPMLAILDPSNGTTTLRVGFPSPAIRFESVGASGCLTPDASALIVSWSAGNEPDGGHTSELSRFPLAQNLPSTTPFPTITDPNPGAPGLFFSPDGTRLYEGTWVLDAVTLGVLGVLDGPSSVMVGLDLRAADGSITELAEVVGSSPCCGVPVVLVFDPTTFALRSKQDVPELHTEGGLVPGVGRFVFHDTAGTSLFVIARTTGSQPEDILVRM
jgi:hypothetical protein